MRHCDARHIRMEPFHEIGLAGSSSLSLCCSRSFKIPAAVNLFELGAGANAVARRLPLPLCTKGPRRTGTAFCNVHFGRGARDRRLPPQLSRLRFAAPSRRFSA